MRSKSCFIKQSLELNLFFLRIMKEHSLFLASSFSSKNQTLIQQANDLLDKFSKLLAETVVLSNGVVSQEVILSGEVVTKFTLDAELTTQFYTGISIDTRITRAETALVGSDHDINDRFLKERVFSLNQEAIALTNEVIQFKENVLNNVLNCNLFTHNYPLLVRHILGEAKLYLELLCKLQKYACIDMTKDPMEQEAFWNRIMAEHAKFIRGMLDPQEEELIKVANNFATEFDMLTELAKKAIEHINDSAKVTEKSLVATKEIKDFKAQGTEGILQCKIKSVILPLLGDHVLREASYYLRLLKMFSD